MQKIKIFLASSLELREDREKMELFLNRKNKSWIDEGIFIELIIWEDFLDALGPDGLQAEYNKAIRQCDIFLLLFFTKVGRYTAEEFEVAIGQYREGGKPLIYTYFKDAPITTGSVRKEDMQSLWAFQEKLSALKHFWTTYKNTEELLLKWGMQLDKLRDQGFIQGAGNAAEPVSPPVEKPINQPEKPPVPPPAKAPVWNMAQILKLLTQAFTPEALDIFALGHFEKVHQQFTPGMAQPARIQLLVTFARNHGQLERLLTAVKAENEYQYTQCGPYTHE